MAAGTSCENRKYSRSIRSGKNSKNSTRVVSVKSLKTSFGYGRKSKLISFQMAGYLSGSTVCNAVAPS